MICICSTASAFSTAGFLQLRTSGFVSPAGLNLSELICKKMFSIVSCFAGCSLILFVLLTLRHFIPAMHSGVVKSQPLALRKSGTHLYMSSGDKPSDIPEVCAQVLFARLLSF
jgi:hypothetical protein